MPSRPASLRDPWFDNAKFALVTLVVIGHMWTLLPDAGAKVWLYDFLYYWHVPAFVIVTGYLSRNFDYSHDRLRALFRTVVVPYMVFELCWRCSACTSATRTSTASWPTRTGRCGTSPPCSSGGCSRRCSGRGVVRRHPDRGRDQPGRRASAPPTGSTSLGCWACCRSS